MTTKVFRSLLALAAAAAMVLAACAPTEAAPDSNGGALTCTLWSSYQRFWDLAAQTYPEIALEFDAYAGANSTGYSWAQMRAGDTPDIFITTQILDEELAKEQLVDLSSYEFANGFSTGLLDQVSIDGGIYLLPVSTAFYGIFYNKTLMEEHGWALPEDFSQLEELCAQIREAGLIPGVLGTQLTGGPFSTVFNLAKTSWLTTPEGAGWERDFLAGRASAAGRWEETMDYVQRYIDIGMLTVDPEDRGNPALVLDYLGNRKAVFCTAVMTVNITQLPDTGDQLGMMPFISEDGGKNSYMYNPNSYIGISKRLTEPGNEEKLENALKLLSLLFSPEGQSEFISEETPCFLSVLDSAVLPEDSMIYDAQQAMRHGRAFPMTYSGWSDILSGVGQAFKEWFRGENGTDGPRCIARMDELQTSALNNPESLIFCQSEASFTLEETGALVAKALGSATGADAAMVPIGTFYKEGISLHAGVTGKLYAGGINVDVSNTIAPGYDGEYAILTMTGAQVKELAETGFDIAGDGAPFPYVLEIRGGGEPEEETVYQVAFPMKSYTGEVGQAYAARVEKGSVRAFLQEWLAEQKTVSPDGNLWE